LNLNQKLDVKTGNFDFQSDHSQDFATKLYRLVNYGKLLKITPSVKIKNSLNVKKFTRSSFTDSKSTEGCRKLYK
jgi:hypothetical protein